MGGGDFARAIKLAGGGFGAACLGMRDFGGALNSACPVLVTLCDAGISLGGASGADTDPSGRVVRGGGGSGMVTFSLRVAMMASNTWLATDSLLRPSAVLTMTAPPPCYIGAIARAWAYCFSRLACQAG